MPYPTGDNRTGIKAKRPVQGIKIEHSTILHLIKEYRGNLSKCADALGCARYSLAERIKSDAELSKALADSRERWIDDVEQSTLQQAANTDDANLKKFVLQTQGKSRGWSLDEGSKQAQDIATAAFQFISDRSRNPAESKRTKPVAKT